MLLNFLAFCVSLGVSAADLLVGGFPHASSFFADVLAQTATGTPTPTGTATAEPTEEGKFTLRLAKEVMVRGLTLGVVAFVIGLMIGRPVINWLRDRRIGKSIRIEGPASHQIKTGTPTMGGIIFLIPLVIVIGIFMDIPRFLSLLLPLAIVISCGILGGFDDLLSTVVRDRGGLAGRFKMAWLLVIAFIAAWVIYYPLNHQSVFVPFVTTDVGVPVPAPIYLFLAVVAIVGTANTVNLSDGLDTLCAGTTAIAFVSFGIIAFLQGVEPVVLVCFATVGALLAFLWFNSHPAQVFMGDTGSLTLGALLAVCALLTDQWLLLPLVGIVFVAEGISDILQVLYFKLTKGKRLFRIAPIHHHFEQIGWSEPQVTMRFWLVGMLAGMLGVALALV